MNLFKRIGAFFTKVGKLIWGALDAAGVRGLNDEVVALALIWVKEAAKTALDNAERREWVVRQLVAKRVPESIARLAIELAVQLLKADLKQV